MPAIRVNVPVERVLCLGIQKNGRDALHVFAAYLVHEAEWRRQIRLHEKRCFTRNGSTYHKPGPPYLRLFCPPAVIFRVSNHWPVLRGNALYLQKSANLYVRLKL
jgi:hypothetical protein